MFVEGGGSDGDEEAWLVAMEKGQLDETGYLPRKLGTGLTARQVSIHFVHSPLAIFIYEFRGP